MNMKLNSILVLLILVVTMRCLFDPQITSIAQPLDTVRAMAWSSTGDYLAIAGAFDVTNGISIQTAEGETERTLQTPGRVFSVAWSPSDAYLAATYYIDTDPITRIWDAITWMEVGDVIESGAKSDFFVHWHPVSSTNRFATTTSGSVTLWDVNTLSPITSFNVPGVVSNILAVEWNSDGSQLFTIGADHILRSWDTSNFAVVSELTLSNPTNIDLSADGSKLAISSDDNVIFIVNAFTLSLERILQNTDDVTIGLQAVRWHPNNEILAATDTWGITIWDVTNEVVLQAISSSDAIINLTIPHAIDYSPSGALTFVSSSEQVITSSDENSGTLILPPNTACEAVISDTLGLASVINTGNNAGVPYTICLENSTYTLSAADNSNGLGANGLPVITGDIRIVGNGATITRDATAPLFRFFRVADGANLTLDGVTLSNGETSGDGGAIYNAGTVTVTNSTLTGNTASYEGGAIYNDTGDSLTIENSSFTGNIAVNDDGGAIDNHGSLDISGSTFDGNLPDDINSPE